MPSYPLIVGSSSTPTTFLTVAEHYRLLADQIGRYCYTTVSETLPSGEPGRWVLLDDLKDDEDERLQFAGGYLNVVTGEQAGSQRRIRREGFEGPFGALGLSRVLVNDAGVPNSLAAGVGVEVTTPLPVRRIGTTKGLVDLVREACQRLLTEVRIPLTGNGTSLYSLQGYGSVLSENQLDSIWDVWAVAPSEPLHRSRHVPKIIRNGATVTLDTGVTYTSAESFEVKAYVRASKLVYTVAGGWAYSTVGPVNDSDQVAVPSEWVLPVAMFKGLQYLRRTIRLDPRLSASDKADQLSEMADSYRSWRAAAVDVILAQPQLEALPNESLVGFAPAGEYV